MADTKARPGEALREQVEAALTGVLAEVPRALREAAERSRVAREDQARRMEEAREWIRAGARPTRHRFRL